MSRSPELEEAITSVLRQQGDALSPPDMSADDLGRYEVVSVVESPRSRAPWGWTAAAAAGFLLLALLGWSALSGPTDSGTDPADGPTGSAAFDFATPKVRLQAEQFVVDVADRTFTPVSEVEVSGDPGSDTYTTLELVWFESSVEMRTNIYFRSDGTDWWADEIRTYDGMADSNWIETTGEFFRTPLGSAFEGELHLDNLTIDEMHLEAFRPIGACEGGAGVELVPDYSVISTSGPGSWSATLIDTATCVATSTEGFDLAFRTTDPAIATVTNGDLSGRLPLGAVRFDLEAHAVGETTVVIEVRDEGALVASAEMPVVVDELLLASDG